MLYVRSNTNNTRENDRSPAVSVLLFGEGRALPLDGLGVGWAHLREVWDGSRKDGDGSSLVLTLRGQRQQRPQRPPRRAAEAGGWVDGKHSLDLLRPKNTVP